MRKSQDILAFDYASSRAYDADGHLRVTQTPISMAAVSPYYGSEIPEHRALGLDPNKVYHLLRDPAELEKAAASFDGKPLLFGHVPVTADDHAGAVWAGTVMNPVWKYPKLYADLSLWTRQAIDGVESNQQKELSASYRYRAQMTPGTFEGRAYDGKMIGIGGNHVALVPAGRNGAECVVQDAALARRGAQTDPHMMTRYAMAFSGNKSPGEIAVLTGINLTKRR